jgi:hypothetical protein
MFGLQSAVRGYKLLNMLHRELLAVDKLLGCLLDLVRLGQFSHTLRVFEEIVLTSAACIDKFAVKGHKRLLIECEFFIDLVHICLQILLADFFFMNWRIGSACTFSDNLGTFYAAKRCLIVATYLLYFIQFFTSRCGKSRTEVQAVIPGNIKLW